MLRKNKKKMAIAVLLSLAMIIVTIGCGSNASPIAEEPVTETEQALPVEELDAETCAEFEDVEEPENKGGDVYIEDAGYEADDTETGESAEESAAIPQSTDTTAEITAIVFNRTGDLTLNVGTQNRRTATTTPEGGTVRYTSSNTDVATVDATGNVICISAGTTVITASSGNVSTSYTLTVVAPEASQTSQPQAPQSQVPEQQSGGAGGTGVFAGVNVTVNDRTTPATTSGMPGRNAAVYNFLAADGRILGSISRDAYLQLMERHGVWRSYLLIPPASTDDWAVWFADEFNRHRNLTQGVREAVAQADVESIEGFRREVVRLTNIERERAGLPTLEVNPRLMDWAQMRAEELSVLFSHTRPDGSGAGTENIATRHRTPEQVVRDWMNSPGHRRNILSPASDPDNGVISFTHIGVGCYMDSGGTLHWVLTFGYGN